MNIFLSSKADKQLKKLPPKMHEIIIKKITLLGKNPFPAGSKKLTSRDGWRVRIGDYRILYAVDKNKGELTILSAAHRKDAYKF